MNLRFEISDLRRVWWWLRQWSGDAAYENYLQSRRARGGTHHLSENRDEHSAGCRSEQDAHRVCCPSAGHGSKAAPETSLLSRQEFYLDMLRRRYTGVSRCC